MQYTSIERDYFSLSFYVFFFENNCENRKWYMETLFFYFYFSNVHISTNLVLDGLRLCMQFSSNIIFMSRELCLRYLSEGSVYVKKG